MTRKYTIEEMQKFAEKKNGKCLSSKYVNSQTKLKWQCEKNHVWDALPSNIVKGHWCKSCSSRKISLKYSINKINKILQKRELICISKNYIDCKNKLKFKCKDNHTWLASWDNVRTKKSGCPKCAIIKLNLTQKKKAKENFKEILKRLDGTLVSPYINAHTRVKVKCKYNHPTFLKTPNDIQSGKWCPYCRSPFFKESLCRLIFEHLFEEDFPNVFPKWLKNDRGNRIQLDGHNEELKIAFEYQGEQHYQKFHLFNRSKTLSEIQKSDQTKKDICSNKGVTLIEIPYYIEVDKLEQFIKDELKKHNLKYLKEKNFTKEFLLSNNYKIIDIKKKSNELGFKLLSNIYKGSRSKLKFRCEEKHVFYRTPDNLLRKRQACPYCIGSVVTIEDLKRHANDMGLTLLSKEYKGAHERYEFKCKLKDHRFNILYVHFKTLKGCSVCSEQIRLNNLRAKEKSRINNIISNNKGKLLSNYINANTKVKIECKKGHIFEMIPSSLYLGRWCPNCRLN